LKGHSYPKDQANPATLNDYSISGNDLILTHKKYYSRRFDATDSFRDWRLINVDKIDCDPDKLSRLINDLRIEEIKIVEVKKGKKLIFYSDKEVYVFKCEDIEQEVRGYNRKEILDILLEKEQHVNEVEIENKKLFEFITRLLRFVNGESRDHKSLLTLNQDKDISLATKSVHCLEILTRVKDKLEELFRELPEDVLKYHGVLV